MIDFQKAPFSKRLSAFMLDALIFLIVAVLFSILFSVITGYDKYSKKLNDIYNSVEEEYGISFSITEEEYNMRKKISDQNSELNHILKEKKDFLQMKTQTKDLINLETNFKNSTSIKISTTRLKNKENQQGNNIKQDLIVPKVKKRCLEKSKSKLFCLFCGYYCQNQNNIN